MTARGHFDHAPWWRTAAVLLIVVVIAACARPQPEEALRNALEGVQAAIEARDAGGLADYLGDDFIGPGGLDRDGARRLAALHFMRHGDVGVLPGPLDIELQEGHARVRFSAVLSGGSGRLLPDSAQAWQVDTGWRLVDGEWRMSSAHWTPVMR
ncbi:nuclear transport factor 2 family protein [Luteimonas colneyensis]|jgi:hypothetical protein|uniref:nuclear transport factor 2 family protein n=1 Tax=Luteimonas colneyensis TaxID=2762230 RepID=UPI001CD8FA0F|nr:nuclear transport factor 2 family protein [Luteimonas colneyensis]